MILDNRAGLAQELVDEIILASEIERHELLVVLGAERPVRTYGGECIARALWNAGITFGDNTPINDYEDATWDVAIQISADVCQRERESAYLAYLLAHELGHGRVIREDLSLHAAVCLIDEAVGELPEDRPSAHEQPIEKRLDQFGVAVAESVIGREALQKDVERLLKDGSRPDHDRLHCMLDLEPRLDLGQLRDDVVEFAAAYAPCISRWATTRMAREANTGERSLFEFADLKLLGI